MSGKRMFDEDYTVKLEGLPVFCATAHFFMRTDGT
jgi:hypothetical protein